MNKLLRCLLTLSGISLVALNTAGAKVPGEKYPDTFNKCVKQVGIEHLIKTKNYTDWALNVDFNVIDSLANCYSYFYHMTNRSFVYEPETGKYVTIKRGFYDKALVPSYSGTNSKNNLFIRISDDLGLNWIEPVLVYDAVKDGLQEGRYPSVIAFLYEDNFSLAYSASRVNEVDSKWYGLMNGFYNKEYSYSLSASNTLSTTDYGILEWSSDSRILAGLENEGGESFYQVIVGRASAADEQDTLNSSHIGLRRIVDMSEVTEDVPPQWSSLKFHPAAPKYRSNQIIDLKLGKNNNMYLAVFGNFIDNQKETPKPGVSTSIDKGKTWSEFNIMPMNIFDNFISAEGFPVDSSRFNYLTKGFTVYGENKYSIVMSASAWNGEANATWIIEATYDKSLSSSQWSIRKIAEHTGAYITYTDVKDDNDKRLNPGDYEIQTALSADGKYIIAKWIDLIGYDGTNFTTTDVFMASRKVDGGTWTKPVNVTNSDAVERGVMMPDVVPVTVSESGISGVPLLMLNTILKPGDVARDKQFEAGVAQYLLFGKVDIITSVDDGEEPCDCRKLDIKKITPNPVSENGIISVDFYIPEDGRADFELYDASGKAVLDMSEMDMDYAKGSYQKNIDIKSQSTGSYYLIIYFKGQKVTKLINIVK